MPSSYAALPLFIGVMKERRPGTGMPGWLVLWFCHFTSSLHIMCQNEKRDQFGIAIRDQFGIGRLLASLQEFSLLFRYAYGIGDWAADISYQQQSINPNNYERRPDRHLHVLHGVGRSNAGADVSGDGRGKSGDGHVHLFRWRRRRSTCSCCACTGGLVNSRLVPCRVAVQHNLVRGHPRGLVDANPRV